MQVKKVAHKTNLCTDSTFLSISLRSLSSKDCDTNDSDSCVSGRLLPSAQIPSNGVFKGLIFSGEILVSPLLPISPDILAGESAFPPLTPLAEADDLGLRRRLSFNSLGTDL